MATIKEFDDEFNFNFNEFEYTYKINKINDTNNLFELLFENEQPVGVVRVQIAIDGSVSDIFGILRDNRAMQLALLENAKVSLGILGYPE